MRTALFIPALLLAGCALSPAETARLQDREAGEQVELQAQLAGLTPGKPQSCLSPLTSSSGLKSYGDTLLYKVSSTRIYRNDTSGGCNRAGQNGDVLVTLSSQGRLCQGDIARTVDPGSKAITGSCALGEFVEYRR